jgi:hypothetical protein
MLEKEEGQEGTKRNIERKKKKGNKKHIERLWRRGVYAN